MVVINKDSVSSNSWETIYDLINDNVTDPKSRGVKWIFGAYPDVDSPRFAGFPIIIIRTMSINSSHASIGKKFNKWGISAEVAIYTDYAEHIDRLYDQIISALYSNEDTLEADGLYLDSTDTSDTNVLDINENKVYLKTIVFRFKYTSDGYGS